LHLLELRELPELPETEGVELLGLLVAQVKLSMVHKTFLHLQDQHFQS